MAGDVSSLEAARAARLAGLEETAADIRSQSATIYLKRAEEALALLPRLVTSDEKAAVCRITETWLGLAEAELSRPRAG